MVEVEYSLPVSNAGYGAGSVNPAPNPSPKISPPLQTIITAPIPKEIDRPYDYVVFSANAYNPNQEEKELPQGFQRLTTTGGDNSGYDGAVFINPDTKEIVIAHTGSEPEEIWKDWGNQDGLHIFLGLGLGPQFEDALKTTLFVMRNYPGYTISHTGHSLGGWLAETMAMIFNNQRAISFDSPGSDQACLSVDGYMTNSLSYLVSNLINVGRTIYNPVPVVNSLYEKLYSIIVKRTNACSPEKLQFITRYVSTPNFINGLNGSLIPTISIFSDKFPSPKEYLGGSHLMNYIFRGFDPVSGQLTRFLDKPDYRESVSINDNPNGPSLSRIKTKIPTYTPR